MKKMNFEPAPMRNASIVGSGLIHGSLVQLLYQKETPFAQPLPIIMSQSLENYFTVYCPQNSKSKEDFEWKRFSTP